MAKAVSVSQANSKAVTTAYDPTCRSGQLLLKVAAQVRKHITLCILPHGVLFRGGVEAVIRQ